MREERNRESWGNEWMKVITDLLSRILMCIPAVLHSALTALPSQQLHQLAAGASRKCERASLFAKLPSLKTPAAIKTERHGSLTSCRFVVVICQQELLPGTQAMFFFFFYPVLIKVENQTTRKTETKIGVPILNSHSFMSHQFTCSQKSPRIHSGRGRFNLITWFGKQCVPFQKRWEFV